MQKGIYLFLVLACIAFVGADVCPRPTTCEGNSCNDGDTCCDDVCVPARKIGENCNSTDCTKFCGEGSCYKGVCTILPDDCNCATAADCSSDQQCFKGKCQKTRNYNPCDVQADCSTATICIDGSCQPAAAENQPCGTFPVYYCQPGLYCQRSTTGSGSMCAKLRKENETCTSSDNCEANLYCPTNFGNNVCVSRLATGETCYNDDTCLSDICIRSNNTCAAGPLPRGYECYQDNQCQSNECACDSYNGTQTQLNCTSYCSINETRANGEYCSGDFQCASGICACTEEDANQYYCKVAKCSAGNQPDGTFCTTSAVCKGSCDFATQKCYSFNSVADGGACIATDQCKPGSKCTGKCQPYNGACTSNDDCGNVATCKCGANGAGTCQVDPFYDIYLKCFTPEIQNEVSVNCTGDIEDSSARCKSLIVDLACCLGCGNPTGASILLQEAPFTFDCAAKTFTQLSQPACCRLTSQDTCNAQLANQVVGCSDGMQIVPAISVALFALLMLLQ